MLKTQFYRVCIKSGTFTQIPTFRIKIGKTEKKINPYFIASDKQRYNCDSILERRNQEPELILSVFFSYKFVGSGSIKFNKTQMPNERVQIFNRDHQSIAFVDISLMKIDKIAQVPPLKLFVSTVVIEDINLNQITEPPFLVLKYGELNYQTKNQIFGNGKVYNFNEDFDCPQSEMQRILIQSWCELKGVKKFLGVSLVYLKEKDDINSQRQYDILYMSKKRGSIRLTIKEDKVQETKAKDYSNAVKRTIKTTVVEAVMLNPIQKGTFIKLIVGPQQFQTSALYVEKKQLNWNQAFTMQVNSQKQELLAKICLKTQKDDEQLGRAFLQIAKIANRLYQLTLLNENQKEIGKVYLEFYDHELDVKQVKKKVISKQLADKISSDLEAIKNRYQKKQPLHEYLQQLHAVLEQGLLTVSKMKSQNPVKDLGNFLVNYKK